MVAGACLSDTQRLPEDGDIRPVSREELSWGPGTRQFMGQTAGRIMLSGIPIVPASVPVLW